MFFALPPLEPDSPEFHAAMWGIDKASFDEKLDFIKRAPVRDSVVALDAVLKLGGGPNSELYFASMFCMDSLPTGNDEFAACLLRHLRSASERRRSLVCLAFCRTPLWRLRPIIADLLAAKRKADRRAAVELLTSLTRQERLDQDEVQSFIVELARQADDEMFLQLRTLLVAPHDAGSDGASSLPQPDDCVGVESLAEAIAAYGGKRVASMKGEPEYDRLTELIRRSQPADGEKAETVQRAMERRGISTKSQIEVAMFAPQWAELIGDALETPALARAVDWFRVHMSPCSFYDWGAPELWHTDGLVDVDGFCQLRREMSDAHWAYVRGAAILGTEFIAGPGHHRPLTWSAALDGSLTVGELEGTAVSKRDQNALVGLAIAPLPKTGAGREVARRVGCIEAFGARGDEVGSSKRATEKTATIVAMRNLERLASRSGLALP